MSGSVCRFEQYKLSSRYKRKGEGVPKQERKKNWARRVNYEAVLKVYNRN